MSDPFLVSGGALQSFRTEASRLVTETASRALARTEDTAHHGAEATRLITSGIELTVRMMDAAMAAGESALMEDQLRWSVERLPHDGVSMEQVVSRFVMLREVVMERMPPAEAREVARVIAWMENRLRELAARRRG